MIKINKPNNLTRMNLPSTNMLNIYTN